jgi:heterotetrameric sarcosine oxidase delta subunit
MSFLLPCPNCGSRDVNEFACAGEVTRRPKSAPESFRELTEYLYFRDNVAGVQREWWYHRHGCEMWFFADRDTRTNDVIRSELPSVGEGEVGAPREAAVPDTPST